MTNMHENTGMKMIANRFKILTHFSFFFLDVCTVVAVNL